MSKFMGNCKSLAIAWYVSRWVVVGPTDAYDWHIVNTSGEAEVATEFFPHWEYETSQTLSCADHVANPLPFSDASRTTSILSQ